MQVREDRSKRWPLRLGLVFLVALVARVGHVAAFLRSPAGDTLVLDAKYYHREALQILGRLPGDADGVSFMNVGYPYALAAVYSALECVDLRLRYRDSFPCDASEPNSCRDHAVLISIFASTVPSILPGTLDMAPRGATALERIAWSVSTNAPGCSM